MTTNALKLLRPTQVLQIAVVEWTAGTTSPRKRLCLCTAGAHALTATAGGHKYQPRIALLGKVKRDSGSGGEFEITIKNQGWIEVEEYGPGYSHTGYKSIAHVMQVYPQLLATATVALYDEGLAPNGDVTVSPSLVARVVAPINVCAFSITLRCRQTEELRRATMPKLVVGPDLREVGMSEYVPSNGAVCPVSLGDCALRLPEYDLPTDMEYCGGVFGWDVPAVPVTPYARNGSGTQAIIDAVLTETGDGLSVSAVGVNKQCGYVDLGDVLARLYSPWQYQPGNWTSGTGFLVWDSAKGFIACIYDVMPFAQVPVVPTPLADASSEMLKAVDRDPTTYATMTAGQSRSFVLGKADQHGRISLNSTDGGSIAGVDYEGVGYPVGLKAMLLLARPIGKPAPTGATPTVTLSFCYPSGSLWIPSGTYKTQIDVLAPAVEGTSTLHQLNLPYSTGTYGQSGWAGTRWHNWDFVAGGSDDINDADYPIWPGSDTYANKPMRITVKNNCSNSVYVAAVVLLVGCRLNREPSVSVMSRHWKKVKVGGKNVYYAGPSNGQGMPNSRQGISEGYSWLNSPITQLGTEAEEDADAMARPDTGRNGWGRGPGTSATPRRARVSRPTTFDSNVYVAMELLCDNASGTYTGTAGAALYNPLHFARYFMKAYGKLSDAGIRHSSGLGAYTNARNGVQNFLKSGASTVPFRVAAATFNTKASVEDGCQSILENCFGSYVKKMKDGTWGFFPWLPVHATISSYTARTYSSTPLDVKRLIPTGPDGGPDFDHGMQEGDGVINNLEITYHGKTKKTARAYKVGSLWTTDDGYGNPWNGGLMPWSNSTPIADLLALSEERFGEQETMPVSMPECTDRDTVVAQGLYLLGRHWLPPITMRMSSLLPLYDLEPGHIFKLNNELQTLWGHMPLYWGEGASWESLWWECTSNDENSLNGTFEITAQWVPYDIGDFTKGMIWGGGDDLTIAE